MRCSVCEIEIEEAQAARLLSWTLCSSHAELAIHASRQMNEVFSQFGIAPQTQTEILSAGQGILQAWQAVGRIATQRTQGNG